MSTVVSALHPGRVKLVAVRSKTHTTLVIEIRKGVSHAMTLSHLSASVLAHDLTHDPKPNTPAK